VVIPQGIEHVGGRPLPAAAERRDYVLDPPHSISYLFPGVMTSPVVEHGRYRFNSVCIYIFLIFYVKFISGP
jgi:hypothetical protein